MGELDAATTDGDASALCRSCGLCCGSLFALVKLAPADMVLAQEGGATIIEHDGQSHAALPCTFLGGSVCTVYDRRYLACRTFECRLLRRFRAGKVDWPTARARIDRLRALMEGWRCDTDPADRRAVALAKVNLVAFNQFADRYFRNAAVPEGQGPGRRREEGSVDQPGAVDPVPQPR